MNFLGVEKVFNDVLNSKQTMLDEKKCTFVKGQKFDPFERGRAMVFVKKWKFGNNFFLRKTSLEKVFDHILFS